MNQTQQPSRFKTGDLIRGRYRIQTFIGEGTMARVYYAFDTLLPTGAGSRDRALKILDPQETAVRHSMPAQEAIDAFKREANILLRITHPNIVRAYDYFEDNGLHILVLEYVSGTSLEAQRRQKKFTEPEVIDIADQILAALQYLHAEKIANRDLKPANIMMNTQNILKLIDFGTAREIGSTVSQGTSVIKGTAIGTPGYAAPEQWNGVVDKRSDIYAWGVIVRELLTGNDPQMFDTTPLTGFNPVLCQMVMGATKLDPNERYQSTEEMKQILFSTKNPTTIIPVTLNMPLNNSTRTVADAWKDMCSAEKRANITWKKEVKNFWLNAIEFEKRGLQNQALSQLRMCVQEFNGTTQGTDELAVAIELELLGEAQKALHHYHAAVTKDPQITEAFDGIARLQAQKAAKRQKVINFFTAPIRWVKTIPSLLGTFLQLHPRHTLDLLTPQKVWLLHTAAILGVVIGTHQNISIARFDLISITMLVPGIFLFWCFVLNIGYHIKATPGVSSVYTLICFILGTLPLLLNGPFASSWDTTDWGPRALTHLEARNAKPNINLGSNWGKRAEELDPERIIRVDSQNLTKPHQIQKLLVEKRTGTVVKELPVGVTPQREETIKMLNESLNQGEKL